MQYTEKELSKLIEQVEKEFTAHLTKAEENFNATLAKSEDAAVSEAPEAKEEKAEASEQAQEAEKAEEIEKSEKVEEQPLVKAEEAKEEKEEKAEDKDDEHCDYDEEDMEEMHKMYKSMKKAELKTHHDSIMKAMHERGLEKCGEMQQMAKSETAEVKEEKPEVVKEVELLKSEIEAEKAKSAELKKNLDAVSEFLTKLVKKTAPQGKAITNLDVVAKSEDVQEEKELSKGEITAILGKKAADPSLSKSDREAINAFYLNNASVKTISHLLK